MSENPYPAKSRSPVVLLSIARSRASSRSPLGLTTLLRVIPQVVEHRFLSFELSLVDWASSFGRDEFEMHPRTGTSPNFYEQQQSQQWSRYCLLIVFTRQKHDLASSLDNC
ncbi:hypothetical protein OPV22_030225 [Ensete ventricosum]|uniref:Uncharacterized protein n=1 Tax=Ensete ventricosum TaxID=4639 RepID=A0AAV8QDG8_ENSVE|nr:hypothetical protein OPV22_030225 [Ensete ventricosum]